MEGKAKSYLNIKTKGIDGHLIDIILPATWPPYDRCWVMLRKKVGSPDLNLCLSFFYLINDGQQEPRNKVPHLSPKNLQP